MRDINWSPHYLIVLAVRDLVDGRLISEFEKVTFRDANVIILSTTIYFQSTQSELALLQPAILSAITAYENLATTAGLSTDQINALQTVNDAPQGGHCEFDGKGFSSAIQVMANALSNVIQPGDGSSWQ
jgi:hypothetical protein